MATPASVVTASTAFALDLYKKVCEEAGAGQNVFMSPYSISAALGMVLLGARNQTAQQMKEAQKFTSISDEDVHASFGELHSVINGDKEAVNYILKTANKLFIHQQYSLVQEFLDQCAKHYRTSTDKCDFGGNSVGSKNKINAWVEDQTENKIKDLIPDGILNDLTRLVLVNAIYFKGNWRDKFDAKHTKKGKFYVNETDSVEVDMMFNHEKYGLHYDRQLAVKVVQMQYVDEHLSMFLLVPDKRTGLSELEAALTPEKLTELTATKSEQKIMLHLPKFKLEHSFSAKDVLVSLGMHDLFDDVKADLSGISGAKDLYASEVLHKAFIEVNEEGSEAAAATAVMMMCLSMPPSVEVDRPFVLAIRDNRTSSFLFVGRLCHPQL